MESSPPDKEYGILWRPNVPPKHNQAHQAQALMQKKSERDISFPVYIYMPLGGSDGSKIDSLCRITCLQGNYGFLGFLLTYSNGEEVLYGQRQPVWSRRRIGTCVEQPFLINGPEGERVVHFGVSGILRESTNRVTHMEVSHLIGNPLWTLHLTNFILQVRTNFGRCCTFGNYDGSTTISACVQGNMLEKGPQSEVVSLVIALPDVSIPIQCGVDVRLETNHRAAPSVCVRERE